MQIKDGEGGKEGGQRGDCSLAVASVLFYPISSHKYWEPIRTSRITPKSTLNRNVKDKMLYESFQTLSFPVKNYLVSINLHVKKMEPKLWILRDYKVTM